MAPTAANPITPDSFVCDSTDVDISKYTTMCSSGCSCLFCLTYPIISQQRRCQLSENESRACLGCVNFPDFRFFLFRRGEESSSIFLILPSLIERVE